MEKAPVRESMNALEFSAVLCTGREVGGGLLVVVVVDAAGGAW